MASSRRIDAILDTVIVCPGWRGIEKMIRDSTDEVEKAAIVKYVIGKVRDRLNRAKDGK